MNTGEVAIFCSAKEVIVCCKDRSKSIMPMEIQTFCIRSLVVQNIIMGIVVAIIVTLLVRCLWKRKYSHLILVLSWGLIVLWFFNGPLWGFSAVTVSPKGLEIHYGFLSVFRNTTLPVHTQWKIRRYQGGIRKLNNLYFFQLSDHRSLKVGGVEKIGVLRALGDYINFLNGENMGDFDEYPINM